MLDLKSENRQIVLQIMLLGLLTIFYLSSKAVMSCSGHRLALGRAHSHITHFLLR